MDLLHHIVRCHGNKGLTAFAIIETSHIAMHIWDEPVALLQLDVYLFRNETNKCYPLEVMELQK